MRRYLYIAAIGVSVLVLLTLSACWTEPVIYTVSDPSLPLATPVGMNAQSILDAAMTAEIQNAGNQAVATAEIMVDNAQATMNFANATLNAAQTQDQNYSNVVAAQIAATAEVARANAQSTLISAGSTQSAALTQDAIRQTQVQYDLQATEVAGTRSASIANDIATQTQASVATSQWYADQERQRVEQWRGSIASLWTWCLPVLLVLVAVLVFWGIWSWLSSNKKNDQVILEDPVDTVHAPTVQVIHNRQDGSSPDLERDGIDSRTQLRKPDRQARQWLDEVKRKLLRKDKQDDNPDN